MGHRVTLTQSFLPLIRRTCKEVVVLLLMTTVWLSAVWICSWNSNPVPLFWKQFCPLLSSLSRLAHSQLKCAHVMSETSEPTIHCSHVLLISCIIYHASLLNRATISHDFSSVVPAWVLEMWRGNCIICVQLNMIFTTLISITLFPLLGEKNRNFRYSEISACNRLFVWEFQVKALK